MMMKKKMWSPPIFSKFHIKSKCVCMIYCGVFKVLQICCVVCNCRFWGFQITNCWFDFQFIGVGISNLYIVGLRLGFQFVDCWVGVRFPMSRLLHFWVQGMLHFWGFEFVDCWIRVGFLVCRLLGWGWVSNFQVCKLLGFPMFRLLHILGF